MYTPQQFEETRLDALHGLIRSHPLGTLVVPGEAELVANHIPFLIDPSEGEYGTLRGHVARANPVWRQFGTPLEAIAIFHGPDSYISPSWYPSKRADGKVLPTWDYAVVHAYGRPRPVEDTDWLREHVTELTRAHEAGRASPWEVSDAPADYVEQMLRRIVGVEMRISRLRGKWKVSQNRNVPDRLGVAAGLESQATDTARRMAELVVTRIPPAAR